MEKHVVKRTFSDGRELYLNPSLGFCCEGCGGDIYVFASKSAAKKEICRNNKYIGIPKDVVSTEIMTYDDYIIMRDVKLKNMSSILTEKGYETHIENHRLYVYLSGMQFEKIVARWYDLTLDNIEYVKDWETIFKEIKSE